MDDCRKIVAMNPDGLLFKETMSDSKPAEPRAATAIFAQSPIR